MRKNTIYLRESVAREALKAQKAFERKDIRNNIVFVLRGFIQDTNNQNQTTINKLNDMLNHQEYFDLSKDVSEDVIDELLQYRYNEKPKSIHNCNKLIKKVYNQYKTKVKQLQEEDSKRPSWLRQYLGLSNINLDNGFFIQ